MHLNFSLKYMGMRVMEKTKGTEKMTMMNTSRVTKEAFMTGKMRVVIMMMMLREMTVIEKMVKEMMSVARAKKKMA